MTQNGADFSWDDLLPHNVAAKQASWERRMRVRWAVQAGAKQVEIARHLGVSPERIRQILNNQTGTVWRKTDRNHKESIAPAVRYGNPEIATFIVVEWLKRYERRTTPMDNYKIDMARQRVYDARAALREAEFMLAALQREMKSLSGA